MPLHLLSHVIVIGKFVLAVCTAVPLFRGELLKHGLDSDRFVLAHHLHEDVLQNEILEAVAVVQPPVCHPAED